MFDSHVFIQFNDEAESCRLDARSFPIIWSEIPKTKSIVPRSPSPPFASCQMPCHRHSLTRLFSTWYKHITKSEVSTIRRISPPPFSRFLVMGRRCTPKSRWIGTLYISLFFRRVVFMPASPYISARFLTERIRSLTKSLSRPRLSPTRSYCVAMYVTSIIVLMMEHNEHPSNKVIWKNLKGM